MFLNRKERIRVYWFTQTWSKLPFWAVPALLSIGASALNYSNSVDKLTEHKNQTFVKLNVPILATLVGGKAAHQEPWLRGIGHQVGIVIAIRTSSLLRAAASHFTAALPRSLVHPWWWRWSPEAEPQRFLARNKSFVVQQNFAATTLQRCRAEEDKTPHKQKYYSSNACFLTVFV